MGPRGLTRLSDRIVRPKGRPVPGTPRRSIRTVALALKVENYTDTALDYAFGGSVVDVMDEFTAMWIVPHEALGLDAGVMKAVR